jgi:hypothetical protein
MRSPTLLELKFPKPNELDAPALAPLTVVANQGGNVPRRVLLPRCIGDGDKGNPAAEVLRPQPLLDVIGPGEEPCGHATQTDLERIREQLIPHVPLITNRTSPGLGLGPRLKPRRT